MSHDHIFETLPDGSQICFECDLRRAAPKPNRAVLRIEWPRKGRGLKELAKKFPAEVTREQAAQLVTAAGFVPYVGGCHVAVHPDIERQPETAHLRVAIVVGTGPDWE